jgi:hypothetical protein
VSATELELADRSLAGCLRHFAQHSSGGEAQERDGILLFAGAHRYPGAYCNGVLQLDATVDAEETLRAARSFFAARRHGYVVWIRGHADADLARAVHRRGFFERPPLDGMPGMVLSAKLIATQPPAVPSGAQIEPIADRDAAQRYLRVVGEAYGMQDVSIELLAGVFFDPTSALGENSVAVLATLDGRPAAGAMTIVLDGVAGIYWAATAPWARGRGLGATCASLVTRAGFERGARMAALQASQMGTGMWRALGFVEVTRYRRFLAPPSVPGR